MNWEKFHNQLIYGTDTQPPFGVINAPKLVLKPLVEEGGLTGGYILHKDFVGPLLRLVSMWRRRDKKRQRRYQRQKRKQ